MKVISKEVNANLTKELEAFFRHQRICWCALYGKSIEALEPTEAEKTEYEEMRAYIAEENAKAKNDGNKICWTLPIDDDPNFRSHLRMYMSIL